MEEPANGKEIKASDQQIVGSPENTAEDSKDDMVKDETKHGGNGARNDPNKSDKDAKIGNTSTDDSSEGNVVDTEKVNKPNQELGDTAGTHNNGLETEKERNTVVPCSSENQDALREDKADTKVHTEHCTIISKAADNFREQEVARESIQVNQLGNPIINIKLNEPSSDENPIQSLNQNVDNGTNNEQIEFDNENLTQLKQMETNRTITVGNKDIDRLTKPDDLKQQRKDEHTVVNEVGLHVHSHDDNSKLDLHTADPIVQQNDSVVPKINKNSKGPGDSSEETGSETSGGKESGERLTRDKSGSNSDKQLQDTSSKDTGTCLLAQTGIKKKPDPETREPNQIESLSIDDGDGKRVQERHADVNDEDEEMTFANSFEEVGVAESRAAGEQAEVVVHPKKRRRKDSDSDLKEDHAKLEQINSKLEEDIQQLRTNLEEQEKKFYRLQEENNDNLQEHKRLKLALYHHQLQNEEYSRYIETVQKEKDIANKERDNLKNRVAQIEKELYKEKNKVTELKAKETEAQRNLTEEINRYRQQLRSKEGEHKQTIDRIYREADQTQLRWATECSRLNEEIGKRDAEIGKYKKEHEDLLLRYSKLARETLTLDNASVADLSDPYRPTKLGEMFGELYDNEWTDAFEEMADMDDKGKIDQLLGMLKRTFVLSSEMITERTHQCMYTICTEMTDSECSVSDKDFQLTRNGAQYESQTTSTDATEKRGEVVDDVNDGTSVDTGTTFGNGDQSTIEESIGKSVDEVDNKKGEIEDSVNDGASVDTATIFDIEDHGIKIESIDKTVDDVDNRKGEIEDGANDRASVDTVITTDIEDHCVKKESVDKSLDVDNSKGEKEDSANGGTSVDTVTITDIEEQCVEEESIDKSLDEVDDRKGEIEDRANNGASVDTVTITDIEEHGIKEESTDKSVDEVDDRRGELTDNANDGAFIDTIRTMDDSIHGTQEESIDESVDIVDNTEKQTSDSSSRSDEEQKESSTTMRNILQSFSVLEFTPTSEEQEQEIKLFNRLNKKVLTNDISTLRQVIIMRVIQEYAIDEQKNPFVYKYIEECAGLCLRMCLKDPSLYIEFIDEHSSTRVKFNTDMYKAYTRKGKYIEHIVWPCLYLHKDGPLLSKGTAQGGN